MMNNRGQALIEFVLILPITLMLLFAIIDFGLIFSQKCKLENDGSDIIEFIKNDTDINSIESLYPNTEIHLENKNDYTEIKIERKVKIFNFGLERILPNPYAIKIERFIPYE